MRNNRNKHTCGPWEVKHRNGNEYIITSPGITESPEVYDANARIIRVSPEMYDALHLISVQSWSDDSEAAELAVFMRQVAREAIAKARALCFEDVLRDISDRLGYLKGE